jgi:hypothetical protein
MVRRVSLQRPLRHALWSAGLLLGFAATRIGRPEPIVLDAYTGFALVALGLAAWSSRPRSGAGLLMAAAGFAWFLGSLVWGGLLAPRAARAPTSLVPWKGRAVVAGRSDLVRGGVGRVQRVRADAALEVRSGRLAEQPQRLDLDQIVGRLEDVGGNGGSALRSDATRPSSRRGAPECARARRSSRPC